MNLRFIKLGYFEFEDISSLRNMNFLSLNLSFETSLPNFGSNISSTLEVVMIATPSVFRCKLQHFTPMVL